MRRGTSVVEAMVALTILSLMLVPILTLARPANVEVSGRASAAGYLLGRLVQKVRRVPYAKLEEFLVKSPEVAHGYREVSIDALLPGPRAATALTGVELHLYVRGTPHVSGQYGLDRVDLKLGYGADASQRFQTRSFVRRNARELHAMSRLRLYRPIEDMSDDQVREAVRTIARQTALLPMSERREGSRFVTATYPGLLRYFEGFENDPASIEEDLSMIGSDSAKDTVSWGDYLSEGPAPRPNFGANSGICD